MLVVNENLISNGHFNCTFEELKNIDGKKLKCDYCCLIRGSRICKIAPCSRFQRTDGKTGYFTFIIMDIKISKKQNVITRGDDKYRAIAAPYTIVTCKLCGFHNSLICNLIPCESFQRLDGRDVYFKLVTPKK